MFYVVMAFAIIGKIKEWMDSRAAAQPPTIRPQSQQPSAPASSSEEERMRRFLEALGTPNATKPSPPPLTPVARPIIPRVQKKQRPQPQVIRPRAPVAVPQPLPMESRDPGRLEEPASSMESISAEWDAMARGVTLSAMETPQAPTQAQAGLPFAITTASTAAELRTAMRTPATLRTAVLLREILGPPLSLQN